MGAAPCSCSDPEIPADQTHEQRIYNHVESEQGSTIDSTQLGPPTERWNPLKSMDVDKEVLRGIKLHSVLRWPSMWMKPRRFQQGPRCRDVFERSERVDQLEMFLSHSWRAPGQWKLVGLLLRAGWLHALFGWLLATTLGVYLRVANLVDAPFHSGLGIRGNYYQCTFSYWLFLLGPMGLMAGLMVSPYLPRSESVCFLDLACIHAESSLKRRGINNIGGCLAVSQELRVLYHPSNFTSLWCMFELAAFRQANPGRPITLTPLFLSRSVSVLYVVYWGMALGTMIFLSYLDEDARREYLVLMWLGVQLLPWFLLVHISRKNYQEKSKLLKELRSFELEKVTCESDFDKEFIYGAIDQWYGSQEGFTSFVRGPLCDELLSMLPRPHLPASAAALIATSAWTWACEACLGVWNAGAGWDTIVFAFSWSSYACFMTPMVLNLLFYMSDYLSLSSHFVIDIAKSMLGTATVLATNALGIVVSAYSYRQSTLWLATGSFTLHLFIFLWTFWRGFSTLSRRIRSATCGLGEPF